MAQRPGESAPTTVAGQKGRLCQPFVNLEVNGEAHDRRMHATEDHRVEPSSAAEPTEPVPSRPPVRRTYNVAEVADLLGVSRSSLYESIRRGELRALQFGRRVVIPVSVVEKMLAGDEEPTEPATSDA